MLELIALIVTVMPQVILCAKLDLTVYTSTNPVSRFVIEEGSMERVFVGCENSFLQLNSSLYEVKKVSIGPKWNSEKCFADIEGQTCSSGLSRTANTVTVLAINQLHNYILMCGSIYQGLCSAHPLSDITDMYYFSETDHSSFVGSKESAVAFFGTPPRTVSMDRRLLYAAVATYDRTEDRFSPRTISTREVVYDPENASNSSIKYFLENDDQQQYSYLTVSTSVQSKFKVKYLYGFEIAGYKYYIAIQPVDADISRTNYVTRLIQFCENDSVYKTYVESVIMCSKGTFNYTIATAAYIQKADNANKLAVSFVRPKPGTSEPNPEYGSVVCIYDMSNVRTHINNLQKLCSNGGSGSYPWWIYGTEQKCTMSSETVRSPVYCNIVVRIFIITQVPRVSFSYISAVLF